MKSERKAWKKAAKGNFKRHYLLFVAVCLALAFLGAAYGHSLGALRAQIPGAETGNTGLLAAGSGVADVAKAMMENRLGHAGEQAREKEAQYRRENKEGIFGRSRGVLAQFVNSVTSGNILVIAAKTLLSLFHSPHIAALILILASFLLALFWWVFFRNIAAVVAARLFLEGRVYADVPLRRFFFLRDVRCWFRAARTMLFMVCLQVLWSLTVVGGVIKRYSYYLVPYIVAENPKISAKEAVNLSRRMMDGHKWECFLLELSFFGWGLLGVATAGASEILFSNPYRSASLCEYYASLRGQAGEKRLEGAEWLNDTYLFEKADARQLEEAYPEEEILEAIAKAPTGLHGTRRFLAEAFGIAITDSLEEQAWQRSEEAKLRAERIRDEKEGTAYPTRLSALAEKERRGAFDPEGIHYIRHYSLLSLALMFFSFSAVGWIWEVSLHLISHGVFVNRGALLGPWLPIYGSGAVLILILLNGLRGKPAQEFLGIVALCGVVEYFTSFYLEKMRGGLRWWDYTGYLLNLNGRICAEGLLVFGMGGMAIVYLLAPRFDNLLRRIPKKIRVCLCILLVALFAADVAYSTVHPNMGAGITSMKKY